MKFKDFLKLDGIRVPLSAADKKSAIEKLIDILVDAYKLNNRQAILTSVFEREALMSTGIGKGVAIPHGKVNGVEEVMGSLAILNPGVEFGSPDGLPVQIVILLVASTKETGPHIRALAHISRILQDENLRLSLLNARNSKEVMEILEKKEKEL